MSNNNISLGHIESDSKIRVALVNPFGFNTKNYIPLSLGYLKSNLNAQHSDVKIIDCAIRGFNADSNAFKEEIAQFKPHLVGVTSWSPMINEALAVLSTCKKIDENIITVIGGAHASTYFDNVIKHDEVDLLFRGEAEHSFALLIDQLFTKNLRLEEIPGIVFQLDDNKLHESEINFVEDLDSIEPPDYAAINLDEYIEQDYRYFSEEKRNAPIWATRGCPYRCQFCSAPILNGRPIRAHSTEYLLKLVRKLYDEMDIRLINIIDDNFTFHKKFAKQVCREIIGLGIKDLKFSTPNGVRLQKGDPELWGLMAQAGWQTVVIAPESGSMRTLELMKKDMDLDIVPGVIEDIHKAGLNVHGFFILGYPGETREDILLTRKFILKCRFDFVGFHIFQALPGTPIYDALVKSGKIQSDYLPKNYHASNEKYQTDALLGVNMRKFIIVTYILYCLRYPMVAPRILKRFGLKFILTRLGRLLGLKTM